MIENGPYKCSNMVIKTTNLCQDYESLPACQEISYAVTEGPFQLYLIPLKNNPPELKLNKANTSDTEA